MKNFFIIIGIIVLSSGCNKIKANRLDGTYECTVTYHSYLIGNPTIDTSYQADLTISSSNGNITVDHYPYFSFPVKLLNDENCYSETGQNYEGICITRETVEYWYGHQYQNSSASTTYVGTRKK